MQQGIIDFWRRPRGTARPKFVKVARNKYFYTFDDLILFNVVVRVNCSLNMQCHARGVIYVELGGVENAS